MLLKSINFYQSKYYSKILKNMSTIYHLNLISQILRNVQFATSDYPEIKKIIEASYTLVVERHTYDKRAEDLIKYVRNII